MDIAIDSHLKASCERLEDSFDLMVLVVTFGLDIEIDAGTVAERLEEMQKHLGWHISYSFAMKLGIPHEPWPSAKVESHLT